MLTHVQECPSATCQKETQNVTKCTFAGNPTIAAVEQTTKLRKLDAAGLEYDIAGREPPSICHGTLKTDDQTAGVRGVLVCYFPLEPRDNNTRMSTLQC
jgi:hypothetical protein